MTVDAEAIEKQQIQIQNNSTLISSANLRFISTRTDAAVSNCSIQAPSTLLSVADFTLGLPCSLSNSLTPSSFSIDTIRMEADTSFPIGSSSGSDGVGTFLLTADGQLASIDPDSANSLNLQIELSAADFVWNCSNTGVALSLGYSSWLIQVTSGGTVSTSTLSLTSDSAAPDSVSGSPVSGSANLQQSELNLISIPSQASVLGLGPIVQFGGSSTDRLWLDSIQFDCVSCRQLIFDCSESDSCELILPTSDSESVLGIGVQLNVSNPAITDSFIAFRSRSNLLIEQPLILGTHSSRPYELIAGSNCVANHHLTVV